MGLREELHFPNPIDSPAHELCLAIVRTAQLLTREASNVLRPHGLTDAQFNVLMLLRYQAPDKGLSQAQLGDMLLVSRPNITGLVDRLEEAGFVRRVDDPEDRRIKHVQLNKAGTLLVERACADYMARLNKITHAFTPDDHLALASALNRIRQAL